MPSPPPTVCRSRAAARHDNAFLCVHASSEAPQKFAVYTALDFTPGGGGTELCMAVIEKIQPHQGDLQRRQRTPGHAQIQRGVTVDVLEGDLIYITQGGVDVDIIRQIE